ncbi:hypothetical protein GCM10010381_40210 [Streptomyces xantholiticus]|nr:hypothetical protein GCM10010381_40210 [Streptomyces xantholiticus]
MIPMPNMDSGILPRKPAAENPTVPGVAKIARYGLDNVGLRSGSGRGHR